MGLPTVQNRHRDIGSQFCQPDDFADVAVTHTYALRQLVNGFHVTVIDLPLPIMGAYDCFDQGVIVFRVA